MVVILIILLVSAVVLPPIFNSFKHREVTEAARILQAGLVQARATAVKANAPRGIRLLPDPTYANSPSILAYNRWVPIEPGPDYANGKVVLWPIPDAPTIASLQGNSLANLIPPTIPFPTGGAYPYMSQSARFQAGFPSPVQGGQVLMIEQAPFISNDPSHGLENPTSWFWNIRVGDSIQINGQGRKYTVIGPMVINPLVSTSSPNFGNPELFVNDGPPGNDPALIRQYINSATGTPVQPHVEYLFLVNGQDDDQDGFIDNGWDGADNNYDGTVDDPFEFIVPTFNPNPPPGSGLPWKIAPSPATPANGGALLGAGEVEQWTGAERSVFGALSNFSNTIISSSLLPTPMPYTISRRPVPSPGARETSLPSGVVIDATSARAFDPSQNPLPTTPLGERSRLPIDQKSQYVDILFNQHGQAITQTEYSAPTSVSTNSAFYHFWLAERGDVAEINPIAGVPYLLPMPLGATTMYGSASGYPAASDASGRALKGERMIVTLFTKTGQVTTNSAEWFSATDPSMPFYDSQLGAREAK